MKIVFLLLFLLTDHDAVPRVIHSCFTSAMVSVAVLFFAGSCQVIRRSLGFDRRNRATPSRA